MRVYSNKPIRKDADRGVRDPSEVPVISGPLKLMILALGFETICLFIRYVIVLPKIKTL